MKSRFNGVGEVGHCKSTPGKYWIFPRLAIRPGLPGYTGGQCQAKPNKATTAKHRTAPHSTGGTNVTNQCTVKGIQESYQLLATAQDDSEVPW